MIVGREAELERIDGFLGAVADGPATLLLEGELGVGKSALWHEAVARSPYRVLACRPVEAETQLAYAALGDLLAELSGEELAALPDPQRHALEVALLRVEPGEHGAPQRAVALGLLAVLRARPTVVAVDDLQWLDHPSEVVLGFVARRLEGARVGLLVARRGGGAMPLHLPETARVTVGPLAPDALARMLAAHGPVSRPELARVARASGGNPYFALELVGHETVPEGLRGLVADRLGGAVAGGPRGGGAGRSPGAPDDVAGGRGGRAGRARDRWLARAVRASPALVGRVRAGRRPAGAPRARRCVCGRPGGAGAAPRARRRRAGRGRRERFGRRGPPGSRARRARRRRRAARAGAAAHARVLVATWRRGRRAAPRGGGRRARAGGARRGAARSAGRQRARVRAGAARVGAGAPRRVPRGLRGLRPRAARAGHRRRAADRDRDRPVVVHAVGRHGRRGAGARPHRARAGRGARRPDAARAGALARRVPGVAERPGDGDGPDRARARAARRARLDADPRPARLDPRDAAVLGRPAGAGARPAGGVARRGARARRRALAAVRALPARAGGAAAGRLGGGGAARRRVHGVRRAERAGGRGPVRADDRGARRGAPRRGGACARD